MSVSARSRTAGYEKRDDLGQFTHTVGVQWDETQARDIDPIKRWAFKTVAKVSQAEYQQILKGRHQCAGLSADHSCGASRGRGASAPGHRQ